MPKGRTKAKVKTKRKARKNDRASIRERARQGLIRTQGRKPCIVCESQAVREYLDHLLVELEDMFQGGELAGRPSVRWLCDELNDEFPDLGLSVKRLRRHLREDAERGTVWAPRA